MVELAAVLSRHWPAYCQKFGSQILPSQKAAVGAILSCRTEQRGAHLYHCSCGHRHLAYHSCQHRACPRCGQAAAARWRQKQQARILPVPYFLVTFTLPQQLRALCYAQQKDLLNLFFEQTAATLQSVAAKPKFFGGPLGLLGVLHTWTRQLHYHPHIHYLIAGGTLSEDGSRWHRPSNPKFFLPIKLLARVFRNRFHLALQQRWPHLLAQVAPAAWQKDWVVDIQPAAQADHVLGYLSAYVARTALSSGRILADHGHSITLSYRDRQTQSLKQCRLSPTEFIRRVLQHTLPKGFQRIRTFGWRSPAAKDKWQRILSLLRWAPPLLLQPSFDVLCQSCGRPMSILMSWRFSPSRSP